MSGTDKNFAITRPKFIYHPALFRFYNGIFSNVKLYLSHNFTDYMTFILNSIRYINLIEEQEGIYLNCLIFDYCNNLINALFLIVFHSKLYDFSIPDNGKCLLKL